MRRALPALGAALLLGLLVAGPAAGAGARTVAGWPRAVHAGPVLPGPSGGLVVVSEATGRFVTSAYRRDGRRLWGHGRRPSCGNCDDGPQPVASQPDGTYGPVGYEGDDLWAVDARGRERRGCAGAVAADGTCTDVRGVVGPGPGFGPVPTVTDRDAVGATLWTAVEPGLEWFPENDVPPMVVADGSGRLYSGLPFGRDPLTGDRERGRLIAIDPSTRSIAWRVVGPHEALAPLRSGVLAARGDGVVALGADGTELWSRGVTAGQRVSPGATIADPPRGRIYLGRLGTPRPGVTAIDAATGRQAWRTRPADRARLLSVGRGGRVYLAIDAPGRLAVRAVRFRDGRTVWRRRTRLPVQGARELADGTVAVSAGFRYAASRSDRLSLLDPR